MNFIKMAEEFGERLVNRNSSQGDGKHTAVEFRKRFLSDLDVPEWWRVTSNIVEIDFSGVRTLGPSWANEAFAYFTAMDLSPKKILEHIHFRNISDIKLQTIKTELESGYAKR